MKIAIIMNKNSYPGREYLKAFNKAKIVVDVISIGNFPEIDEIEEERCGGFWTPPSQSELTKELKVKFYDSLKDEKLIEYLGSSSYDVGIQGGTGIIKNNIIMSFKYGILNFHPGDLPEYRGCSAPEWQLYENKNIISTCHLIDEGIDSGKIIEKKKLAVSLESYELFRASIYVETAKFVVEIINKLMLNIDIIKLAKVQNARNANYRKYIGKEKIDQLRSKLFK